MVSNEKREDLRNMYILLKPITEGLKTLIQAFLDHIKNEGIETISTLKGETVNNFIRIEKARVYAKIMSHMAPTKSYIILGKSPNIDKITHGFWENNMNFLRLWGTVFIFCFNLQPPNSRKNVSSKLSTIHRFTFSLWRICCKCITNTNK